MFYPRCPPKKKSNRIRTFSLHQQGSVAVIGALSMLGVLMAAGTALDFARYANVKTAMQTAADSAVLAGTSVLRSGGTTEEAKEAAQAQFDHQVAGIDDVKITGAQFDVEIDKGVYRVKGDIVADVNTTLMKLAKFESISFGIDAQAGFTVPRDEITFVIDVSWSMGNNGRLKNLKAALDPFIDKLAPFDNGVSYRVISLVPYAESVNFGSDYASWLGPETTDAPYADFVGCFRPQSDADIASSAVDSDGPGTFLPFHNEDYSGLPLCPPDSSKVTFYSADADALKAQVQGLRRGFGTGTDVATSWGWRTLQPSWRGIMSNDTKFPQDFSVNNKKFLIILTDGRPRRADMDGDGVLEYPKSDGVQKSSENFDAVCNAIRAEGSITVFTIGYDFATLDGDFQTSLSDCASNGGRFINANTQNIGESLQLIARQISSVRLTN